MLVIKDFATTTIASALTAAATSIVVSDASRLPALPAGDHFDLVLQKFTDRNYVEIVRVTGVSGNTLTVARGRDGTMGRAFSIGDYAEQRVTVGTFSEYIAQSVAGKVDKSGAVVEQALSFLNTGDLVSAGVGIAYEGNRHVTALGGGVGANTINPFVALRPLGKDNSSVQAIYDFNGNFALLGGERKAEVGKLVSSTPADSFGWPNATANNANNYNTRFRQKVSAGNNAIYIFGDGAENARRFGIQSGHESPAYANVYGILDLNPFGGIVRVNGGIVYHTNYAPTPAAVGALALVGGTLTGPLGVRPSVGVNPLDLFSTPNPAGTSAQGVAGWDNTGATREWGVGRYATAGVAEYAYFGFGVAPWNSGLRVYGAGDIRAGAVNRLYHEGYLPTPDVLGAVPRARTINTKPLTSNVVLSAADVGALPVNANAVSATKLLTARTINGTNFDGTADITTANWGTARTLTIGGTAKSVNGAGNVAWSLAEIGAARAKGELASGATENITTAQFVQWLKDSGAFDERVWIARGSWSYANNKTITDTGCGNIHLAGCTIEVISGSKLAFTIRIITPTTTSGGGTTGAEFVYVDNGSAYSPGWRRIYTTAWKPTAADVDALPSGATAVAAAKLATARTIGGVAFDGTANINLPGVNTTGNQSTTGNAATATKLQTARTIALTGDVTGSVNFDGSGNVSITTTVADDSHNHTIANIVDLQNTLNGKLSTSGKAADSDKLDGLDSSQFLRSDTSNTMTGNLTVTGTAAATKHQAPTHNVGTGSTGFDIAYNSTTKSLDFNFVG